MPETWISEEMRAAIGGVHSDRRSMPISVSDIRKWAQAVHYPEAPPREYWDEEYAATTPAGGIVAPEEFNPFAWMTAVGPARGGVARPGREHDRAPAGRRRRPRPRNMLNGGMEVEYTGVRMRPGDVIRAVTSLSDYSEREGRLGLMLFTTTEQRWTNQDDELIKIQRDVLIRY